MWFDLGRKSRRRAGRRSNFNLKLAAKARHSVGITQLQAILLVRSRTDWCAGVGSPLAGDHRSQATFLLHDPVSVESPRARPAVLLSYLVRSASSAGRGGKGEVFSGGVLLRRASDFAMRKSDGGHVSPFARLRRPVAVKLMVRHDP